MVHCLASFLCSGLSSEPGHCLPFFNAAPVSFAEFKHLALRWYKFPRWSLLILLARSCRKVLTLSAISFPPKLSTTERREKCPQIFHHEGPERFDAVALAPAGPLAHHGPAQLLWAPPCPAARSSLGAARARAAASALNPDYFKLPVEMVFLASIWFRNRHVTGFSPKRYLGKSAGGLLGKTSSLLTLQVSPLPLDMHSLLIW